MTASPSLLQGLAAARELAARSEADRVAFMRWLPLQWRYLTSTARFRLLRAGNQSQGKTTAALADLRMHADGTHPIPRGAHAPGEYWIICASWAQSVAIQGKLYDLIPHATLREGTVFSRVRGFQTKNPFVEIRHKAGGYSIIRFKTTQQGTLDLAGATLRGALFDEPPASEGIYSEVVNRMRSTGGWVSIAMTPVGAPVEWIRALAVAGIIEDIHTPLTPEGLIPIGARRPMRLPDGTVCDATWIAGVEAITPPHEVDVRVHGGWEIRLTDRYFSPFVSTGPHAHVHDRVPDGEFDLCLGIDHGSRPGKQIALLLCIQPVPGGHPRIYVLDEYIDTDGTATPAVDARGILAMLTRHGFQWKDLRYAHGDRVHMPGMAEQKSNRDLQVQIAKVLQRPADGLQPAIRTVKRGAGRGGGSLSVGSRWLFHALVRYDLAIHPRCKRLIESMDRYTMADDDWKDPIDVLRYGLDRWIFAVESSPMAPLAVR